jgi:hypothetical protein
VGPPREHGRKNKLNHKTRSLRLRVHLPEPCRKSGWPPANFPAYAAIQVPHAEYGPAVHP